MFRSRQLTVFIIALLVVMWLIIPSYITWTSVMSLETKIIITLVIYLSLTTAVLVHIKSEAKTNKE